MRKLLQNKTVVSSLCALAVLFVAGNFIDLPVRRLIPVAARPIVPPSNSGEPETLTIQPTPRICTELSEWRELFPSIAIHRDPFGILGAHIVASASTNKPSIPIFALQAVSIERGRALAVINHTIVATGEYLGDYVVERIQPTEVWLKNGFGQVIVSLDLQGTLRTRTKLLE